jgi:CubicO group peptidase (beta-lactamase class C family)
MYAPKRSRLTLLGTFALVILFLASCSSIPASTIPAPTTPVPTTSAPTYNAAIQEGQTAAQDVINQGNATALTIAFVNDSRIIWSQSFGLADRETGKAPTETTMFGIGSTSKMFATVAVMKLIDRGVVELDKPVVNYLPAFRMDSPDYGKITVRMLLNHSSGFPGSDYRNIFATSPFPGYLDQVLQTLSMSRLKAAPGYMNVYCNDGFTVVEELIRVTTGRSYIQFVQDEILAPLGMANTRFATAAFPVGSYAKAYENGEVQPQEFTNAFATGGVYTTANDMARFAMMLLGGGKLGQTQILSATSVAEMAVDQTAGSFNPIRSNSIAYGLGWDTVTQPGLMAVGFDGWAKGGDTSQYHSKIVISPKAQLGVVVIGVSGFNSNQGTVIAERMLLRALAETARIVAFPSPLPFAVPPVVPVPDGLLAAISGEYARYDSIYQIQSQPDGSILFFNWIDNSWKPDPQPLKHRGEGWFSNDQVPLFATKVIEAGGTQYIVKRYSGGYGHYLDNVLLAQRVRSTGGNLSTAWSARLPLAWLVVNSSPETLAWSIMNPRLSISTIPELSGLIVVRGCDSGSYIVDPSSSDTVATMMLVIPQAMGRDLNDLNIVVRDGVEWTRFGSYLYEPINLATELNRGATTTVTIGSEGYAEWRSVATDATPVRLTITTTGAWRVFDPAFTSVADGKGSAETSLPTGNGLAYIILFGDPGQTITVTVQ